MKQIIISCTLLLACAAQNENRAIQPAKIPVEEQYWHFAIDLDSLQQSVADTVNRDHSAARLKPHYPNPFCPTTNITFEVFEAGSYQLIIYDTTGRKIATAELQALKPGSYTAKTTAMQLNSGVYIYTIAHNGVQTDHKKMLILR